jgi:hypothetical protein
MKKLSWRALNAKLSAMDEKAVLTMLQVEVSGERRATYIERLHQRFCALRDARERVELLKKAIKP